MAYDSRIDVILIAQLTSRILDEAEIGILVVDDEGRMHYANQAMEDLTGVTRGRLVGDFVERLVPPDLREGHVSLRSVFTAGRAPTRWMNDDRGNIRLVNTTGVEVPVRIGLRRVMTEWGRFVFAYVSRRTIEAAPTFHGQ